MNLVDFYDDQEFCRSTKIILRLWMRVNVVMYPRFSLQPNSHCTTDNTIKNKRSSQVTLLEIRRNCCIKKIICTMCFTTAIKSSSFTLFALIHHQLDHETGKSNSRAFSRKRIHIRWAKHERHAQLHDSRLIRTNGRVCVPLLRISRVTVIDRARGVSYPPITICHGQIGRGAFLSRVVHSSNADLFENLFRGQRHRSERFPVGRWRRSWIPWEKKKREREKETTPASKSAGFLDLPFNRARGPNPFFRFLSLVYGQLVALLCRGAAA